MADISTRIGLEGDKEFKSALKEITTQSKALGKEMRDVTSSFTKNMTEQEKARAKAEVLSKQYDTQKDKVKLLKEQYEKQIQATGKNSEAALKLKDSLKVAEMQLNKTSEELKEAKKQGSNLTAAFDKLKSSAEALGKIGAVVGGAVAAVGAATVAAGKKIFDLANETASAGDEIDKQSQKIGVSAEQYQALAFAAERSGTDIAVFQTAAKKLAGTKFDGNVAAAVDAVMALGTEEERTAKATELFGAKAAQELQPLIQGGTTVAEFTAELEGLGGIMSNEAVSASAKFSDSLTNLQTALKGTKNGLVADLLPGITDVMDGLTGLLTGTEGSAEQIASGIGSIGENLITMVSSMSEVLASVIPALVELLPSLIESLLAAIVEATPSIISSIGAILPNAISTILQQLPLILSTGAEVLVSLLNGIASALPEMIPVIVDVCLKLVDLIIDNLPLILESGISVLMALLDGIIDALPSLIDYIPILIDKVCQMISANLPMILSAGIQILMKLLTGIIQAVPQLIRYVPSIIRSIASGLTGALGGIIDVGKNLVRGLWGGISDMVGWVISKIKGFGTSIMNGIKGIFGIHSPSRLMRDQVGKNLALGIGLGFTDEMKTVTKNMTDALPTTSDLSIQTSASVGYSVDAGFMSAVKSALNDVEVVMDGQRMGRFVNKTVVKAVYG